DDRNQMHSLVLVARPHGDRESEPLHEQQHREDREHDDEDRDLLPAEVQSAERAETDQDRYADHETERLEQDTEQHERRDEEEDRLEVELRHLRSFGRQGLDENREADDGEDSAEHRREVRGPHPDRGAHLIVQRDEGERDSEPDEHQTGPKVLGRLYFHGSLLL